MKFLIVFAAITFCYLVKGQQITPQNGVKESEMDSYAFINASIYISPEKVMNNATLLIKGDEIVKVGTNIKIPDGTIVIDCAGKTILPSFIELHSGVGLPEIEQKKRDPNPQLETSKKGAYYWNESIQPETDAATLFTTDEKAENALTQMGFGFSLTHNQNGIARGTGAFVALGAKSTTSSMTSWASPAFLSLQKGNSQQTYPSSQMGSIALLRQAFYDAKWYHKTHKNETRNLSLEALSNQMDSSLFFVTKDKWEILRGQKIANEFGLKFTYIGSGNEYEIASELAKLKRTIVIPLTFPKAYDVRNPYNARQIPLSELKHWELAPHNAEILAKNNVAFCFSAYGLKSSEEFWKNLQKAINCGLTEGQALNALTLEPAKVLGIDKKVGTIEVGKKASFIIYSENPFQKEAKVLESWSLGNRIIHNAIQTRDISGKYNILIDDRRFPIEISKKGEQLSGKLTNPIEIKQNPESTNELKTFVSLSESNITLQLNINDSIWKGSINLRGKINTKLGIFEGDGMLPSGKWVKWSAIKNTAVKLEPNEIKIPEKDSAGGIWFPNMAFGFDSIPKAETIIIKNATVWTNEAEGILKNATVIVENGKIKYVGTEQHHAPKEARIIDAEGKHVTCGIIDEHSHIAISKGVNEGGQAISAEVSIGDVINPDDINIYRQLAGGVTCSQLLHGSANPIGGQSAIIKLKWGHLPEDMLIDHAPKFIKCALGENVKQTNWGDYQTIRFPQTRMGVEQVFYDGFNRALAYEKEWKEFKSGILKDAPRYDLELETLLEIIHGKRFITCHSYIQSEILMLMEVADTFGFKINTFTHILEGYKVADEMAEHGAGASTFSDWWAYKYEVNDAIPFNAAMMTRNGIVVAINSDDAEMGRRLNQEAAKSMKYGGLSEVEAWKLVTLNPAILLHLDDRMGSVKHGKDADIVIWSDNPLSIDAKVEYTIVDGQVLYDASKDAKLDARNQAEKARIITKMLTGNEKDKEEKPAYQKKKKRHFHCDTIGEEGTTEENTH